MKNWKSVLLGVVMGASTLTLAAQDDGGVSEFGTPYHWEKGTIVVESPERPAGQKSVLGLTVP